MKVHSPHGMIPVSPHINCLLFPRSSDPSFPSRPSLGQLRADTGVSPAVGVGTGAGAGERQSDSDRNTCSCQSDSVTDGQFPEKLTMSVLLTGSVKSNGKETS